MLTEHTKAVLRLQTVKAGKYHLPTLTVCVLIGLSTTNPNNPHLKQSRLNGHLISNETATTIYTQLNNTTIHILDDLTITTTPNTKDAFFVKTPVGEINIRETIEKFLQPLNDGYPTEWVDELFGTNLSALNTDKTTDNNK